jgi:hypothetical protein
MCSSPCLPLIFEEKSTSSTITSTSPSPLAYFWCHSSLLLIHPSNLVLLLRPLSWQATRCLHITVVADSLAQHVFSYDRGTLSTLTTIFMGSRAAPKMFATDTMRVAQSKLRRKKNVKRGIQFCLMVCGASGTGTKCLRTCMSDHI